MLKIWGNNYLHKLFMKVKACTIQYGKQNYSEWWYEHDLPLWGYTQKLVYHKDTCTSTFIAELFMILMMSRTAFIFKIGADWENVAFIHRKMKLTLSGKWVELRAMLNENYHNQREKYYRFPLCYILIYTCSISHYVLYDMIWNQSNDLLEWRKECNCSDSDFMRKNKEGE